MNGTVGDALGKRLRMQRKSLGLTMQEVADRAGLSVGFISQIERDIAVPSLSSLVSVARVLKIEVGHFLEQPRGETSATRRDTRDVYAVAGNALSYERLSAAFPGNVLRCLIIHEPPGHRTEPISHEGEEMFFILDGSITVEVAGERTILNAGDSIHFPSTITHSSWNHTEQPAAILHTCTMDVFGDAEAAAHAQHDGAVRRHKRDTGQGDQGPAGTARDRGGPADADQESTREQTR